MKKVLVVGLGSMGKRRIRCLTKMGFDKISGVDIREDRRTDASDKFGCATFKTFEQATNAGSYDVVIISLPPDKHIEVMLKCINRQLPIFVEASVILDGLERVNEFAKTKNVLIAPSSTLRFHPAITHVRNIIQSNEVGEISNVTLHSGQYLPDWHAYENVSEFYVSQRETGGAREIVPFELTWLTEVLGFPNQVTCLKSKTINIEGAEDIDDTYNCILAYKKSMVSLTVDVVSRPAIRRLLVNASKIQLRWDWEDNFLTVYNFSDSSCEKVFFDKSISAEGYNENIPEDMYVAELNAFFDAISGKHEFPNNLDNDIKILKLLNEMEESNDKLRKVFQHAG